MDFEHSTEYCRNFGTFPVSFGYCLGLCRFLCVFQAFFQCPVAQYYSMHFTRNWRAMLGNFGIGIMGKFKGIIAQGHTSTQPAVGGM